AMTETAAPNGGDLVARALVRQGVRFLFTLCGGHISSILVGAKRLGIRVVDVRDEASAVFAADAVARLTGQPGVAAVTAGPGATNTLTAVKNAQLAQSPLVLLGGAADTLLKGRGALPDIDQMALFTPHVTEAGTVRAVRDLPAALDRAFRVARSGVPGPVFVECPVDLLYGEELVRQWYGASARGGGVSGLALRWYLKRHATRLSRGAGAAASSRASAAAPASAPPPEAARGEIRKVALRLQRAKRPVLVIGSQAMLGTAEVATLAAAVADLGLPVYLAGGARGLLGVAHPLQLRHRRRDALKGADLGLLAGIPCDFRLDYGRQIGRRADLIAINRSEADLRLNQRPEIGLHAAPGLVLRGLAGELAGGRPPAAWAEWRVELRSRDAEREREIAAQAEEPTEHVNPLHLC